MFNLFIVMSRCLICDEYYEYNPSENTDLCKNCAIIEKKKEERIRMRQKKYRELMTNEKRIEYITNGKYTKAKKRAQERRYVFDISFNYFSRMMLSDCSYCGKFDNPNGVDRIDSSKGYSLDNCTPCCKRCNQMKWDMSIDEFKEHVKLIYFHLIEEDGV
jgi:hypothetical protein